MGDWVGGWVMQSCYKSKYTTVVLVKAVVCLGSNWEQMSQDTDPQLYRCVGVISCTKICCPRLQT